LNGCRRLGKPSGECKARGFCHPRLHIITHRAAILSLLGLPSRQTCLMSGRPATAVAWQTTGQLRLNGGTQINVCGLILH
jgi:hypothetical protein